MSVAQPSALRGQARQWLSAAGLLPLARRAARLYVGLRCATRREFRLVVDRREVCFVTDDAYSTRFFHRRSRQGEMHEPPVTGELARRARDARVFADVGAHGGYYSCIAGALNADLELFLFEMNRDMIPVIERNLCENGRSDGVVVNRPVADRRRAVSYAGSSREPGLSMRAAGRAADDGQVLAETIALDEFFAGSAVRPDLIKIDVEGAELDVLRGARKIIAQHHPVLFVEVHPKLLGDFGGSAEEVYAFLSTHGYAVRRFLEHRGDGTGLRPIDRAGPPGETHMLLCV
jgi:FkbM family methyltransferase